MAEHLRVVLADDHSLVRAGIRALLETTTSVEVVAEASDGRQAVLLAHQYLPDVVLMDISMKGLSGIEATAEIRRDLPQVRVIVLSMYSSADHIAHALRAGASGYMIKDSAPDELERALAAVMRGETYLSSAVSAQTTDGYVRRTSVDDRLSPALTPRQREILQLVAHGKSTREIAQLLALSIKTVETHRAQLMRRLNIYDVPGLVRYALRVGLVGPD